MLYTSLIKSPNKQAYLKNVIKQSMANFREYKVALGLIGRGEGDVSTPLISTSDLRKDLQITKN